MASQGKRVPIPRASRSPLVPCGDLRSNRDTMVAAEGSAYLSENVISYLWTCDTCGYGFVTKHAVKRIVCN